MKNKLLALIVLLTLISSVTFGKENSVKCTPEKPKPGDEITIVYNSTGTPLADSKNVEITYTIFSHKFKEGHQETRTYNMEKEGSNWRAVIKTTPSSEFVAVKFANDDASDNNETRGYFVRFYDEKGNETDFSKLGYASGIASWCAYNDYSARNPEKAFQIMKQIFSEKPDLKPFYFGSYLSVLNRQTPDSIKAFVFKKELAEIEKLGNISDENYSTLIYNYKNLKMPEKADELTKAAIKKYPGGNVAYNYVMDKIYNEQDVDKKKQLAIEVEKTITAPSVYNLNPNGYVFEGIVKKGDIKMLKQWWSHINSSNKEIIPVESNYYVRLLLEANKDLDFALELCKFTEPNWDKPYTIKAYQSLSFITEKRIKELISRDKAFFLMQYGDVLYKLDKKDEAFKKYEKALSIYDIKNLDEKAITEYVKKLIESKRFESAQPVLETAAKRGITADGMQNALKEVYVKKNGNETGFESYYNKLRDEGKAAIEAKQKKLMINQPAPQFTLMDLEGKQVSLSDLKGKVILLDFWATWCGPCKFSFPTMQRAVDKYKDNPNVVFLFVNTFQSEIDKKKNAEDFIKETKYTFHVILDNENKVAASFGVGSIPTKIILDKNGNIRFNVVGASAGDEALEEIATMIKLASE